MDEITLTGATVEEAVAEALVKLAISREQADIHVLDEGKKGFLGIGSRPAKVQVIRKKDAVEEVDRYLKDVTAHMGVDVTTSIQREGKTVTFKLESEKVALLIGKRGQTLNALQSLAQLVANRYSAQFITIVLDAEDYRERRRVTLSQLAERMAHQAVRTKKPVKLEPMPSFERKIIHSALSGRRDIETHSEGNEPRRYLVITAKK
ncbi:RNA-binding cell elongation regulator Jag/EloR [Jeotgalibacillus aurantiacus]|uniref:RNA-binding cell elongation regulator Jag/EloR n=1 Tax=Jeotgalibacillus aurantiacus TaxID=2763266 RepID=UPI001D0B4C15|nr:RNA-binding cell elongation regulator Jag/EloR [Jeotgalibacillus aurantiacus]